MNIIDWLIIGAYALIVLVIGAIASQQKDKNNSDDFMVRRLPWWAVGISIIATSFSAASLLGGPGQGYQKGFLYLQLQFGDFIGYLLVILLFLPFFIRLDLTTAYEYLEKRFDAKTRSLGSICFLLFVIARLGGLLYAASLVVSTVTDLPLSTAILLVGVISTIYTATGGITAVVWTDVLQFVMIFVGLGAGIWTLGSAVDGGLATLWTAAGEGGKLTVINPSWDPESIYSLPTALIAYGILAFAVAGTNQQSVQRYVCCEDQASARKAIFLGWFAGFIGVAATLFLGVLLFGFYSLNGGLPEEIQGDGILSYFIVNQVPAGASGLLVAAIFAAAMSSIDSALHSLATCITVDFYEPYYERSSSPLPLKEEKVTQLLIIFWGVISIFAAFYVAKTGQDLLPFLVVYTSMFLGPLLGVFLMGVLIPRVNGNGAFYGAVSAVILVIVESQMGWLEFPGIWRSAITAPLTVILGLGISFLGEFPDKDNIKGLTLWYPPAIPQGNELQTDNSSEEKVEVER